MKTARSHAMISSFFDLLLTFHVFLFNIINKYKKGVIQMQRYTYLKLALKENGLTLQQAADRIGVTKGYLSQLINNKIKEPSAQKLQALHEVLHLEYPPREKKYRCCLWKVLSTTHRTYLFDSASCEPSG